MKITILISSTIVAVLCASCMKEAESTPQTTTTDESIISQNHDTSNESRNATDEITFTSSKGSINTIRAQRNLSK